MTPSLGFFLLPGLIFWSIFRNQCPVWIGSSYAVILAISFRIISGGWMVHLGGESSGSWFMELSLGIVSWAFAGTLSLLVYKALSLLLGKIFPKLES
ncbi:hypothetical protein N9A94_01680 [Akkermansiaceae bacterium]|nr:hypothetical protein [Akkermansiaceae bacterium]MDB4544536.1 hypothetical protein [Akkermansiaceae bacterium]